MLVYIRLSFMKSELATEEILSDLLDHLLDAQAFGKTASDVFGEDPKKYMEEIISALPKKKPENFFGMFLIIVLSFFGVKEFFGGLFNLIFFYGFSKGSFEETIYLGTIIINIIILLPLVFVFIYLFIFYLRWSSFKQINKVLFFFTIWISSIMSITIFGIVYFLIPEIGPTVITPIWLPIVTGSILLLLDWYVVKKN